MDGEVHIPLTQRRVAIVDLADYGKVKVFNWYFTSHGYASRWCNESTKYLHHEIIGKSSGVVDHIDGNKLNNRRSNLRHTSQRENIFNSDVHLKSKSATSKYKGVSRNKSNGSWRALMWFEGKAIHVKGSSSFCEVTTALAYDFAVVEKYGEGDRRLNFSEDERMCLT